MRSSSSLSLNATATSRISLLMASCHTESPLMRSNSKAWRVLRGTRMPYLVEGNLTRLCTAEMIWSLFLSVCGTHHAKAGSLSSLLALAYSATLTGIVSLMSTSGIQEVDRSSHSILRSHPLVVLRRCRLPAWSMTKASSFEMASVL